MKLIWKKLQEISITQLSHSLMKKDKNFLFPLLKRSSESEKSKTLCRQNKQNLKNYLHNTTKRELTRLKLTKMLPLKKQRT